MNTIHEAIAVAEPTVDVRSRTDSPPSSIPDPTPHPHERDLALQIRMTASSLAGIALIHRVPDSESTR